MKLAKIVKIGISFNRLVFPLKFNRFSQPLTFMGQDIAENCIKMKKIGLGGRTSWYPPLDLPMGGINPKGVCQPSIWPKIS